MKQESSLKLFSCLRFLFHLSVSKQLIGYINDFSYARGLLQVACDPPSWPYRGKHLEREPADSMP
ncbi:MAG: hypothetical protein WBN00_18555, partial [Sedimenticolaceae bacterium]